MNPTSFEGPSTSDSTTRSGTVLLVESDANQRRLAVALLTQWGYRPLAAATAEDALDLLGETRVVFSLVAIRLPGMSGIELVRRAPDLVAAGPVIMIADAGHSEQIVEAIQAGADDFIRRPYTADDLESAVRAAAIHPRREAGPAPEDNDERLRQELALLTSPQMRDIQRVIQQAAQADVTVLVCGETGVGKELVARAIHAHSRRHRAAFVKVNCAAMPRELLESELFGHERGAFTGAHQRKPGRFELADGGTMFLDEIGELHPALQAKLLHVLQDGEFSRVGGRHNLKVDVRTICATNRDLAREVARGRFREDLFYRLNVINILVPPLRERRDDIPGLVEYFVQRYSREFGVAERQLAPGILQAFLSYPWPGNIRELENFIKRMLVLRDWTLARTLVAPRAASTVPVVAPASPSVSPTSIDSTGRSLKEISRQAVLEAEREVIARALEQCRWNRVKTAKMLKISYRALLYKIKDMGLRQDRAAS
jgi:two-component system, NtrC family, response regulator AtoC